MSHYPYCVQIGIDGMTCDHCKARVENTLNSEDGVWAEVDLSQNLATVHMKNNLSELFLEKTCFKCRIYYDYIQRTIIFMLI